MNRNWTDNVVRIKIIYAEIKVMEQEYKRLCNQIEEIEQAKRYISLEVQKKIEESSKISDFLLEQEYECLKKAKQ